MQQRKTTQHKTHQPWQLTLATLACLSVLFVGCDSEPGKGSLTVLLESEDVITEGLEPGSEGENIQDGWAVSFDKYIAAIGDVDVHFATDASLEASAEEVFVVDLTQVPATGLALWTLDDLDAGRWEFNYATPNASAAATKDSSVTQTDYDAMVTNTWTYFVDGEMTKTDGQSCPPATLAVLNGQTPNGNMSGTNDCYDAASVRFTFGASAPTNFGPCEIDEVPGIAITSGSTETVAATIHGDHLFFNGFPEGDEGGVSRLAQWLADCDLNLDGTVTKEELESISPSQLPEIDERFQLGGSPITPLDTMYDYVTSQFKTQGHFQGEGECPLDGMEHDH